jgi:lipid-A-disaccharide synthase
MLVILPFEKDLYDASGLRVEFVGHPLLDVVALGADRKTFAARHGPPPSDTWVGLLPGSRRAEVERLLPPMLEAAEALLLRVGRPRFLIPITPSLDVALYERALAEFPALAGYAYLIHDDYYATLEHATVAAVCSGTATLEAALTDTPMVVVYRTSWLTYNLAKSLVRVRDIGLVNLIAGRRAVPELVQGEVTGPRIADELRTLLNEHARRSSVLAALQDVRRRLGEPGASERAARAVLEVAGIPLRGVRDTVSSARGHGR